MICSSFLPLHSCLLLIPLLLLLLLLRLCGCPCIDVFAQGLTYTEIPARIWCGLLPAFSATRPSGILVLSIFMVVGSNIISNVPLVVLIAEKLGSLAPDVLQPALLAAWTTTVGGEIIAM